MAFKVPELPDIISSAPKTGVANPAPVKLPPITTQVGTQPVSPPVVADPYQAAIDSGRSINTNIGGKSAADSDAQFRLWASQGLYDEATGTWRSSKVDQYGNPIQGPVEHPDACPEGMAAYGENQCRPVGSAQIQGIRPGQVGASPNGQGGVNPGGMMGGMDWETLAKNYGGFKPELGDDYGLSQIYKNLMAGGQQSQEFLAPTLGNINKDVEAQKINIMNSLPAGGQRDKALADLENGKGTNAMQARLGLLPTALGGLSDLYGKQLGAGNDQRNAVLGAYTQGQGYQNQYNIASMDDATKNAIAQMQNALGWGQLNEQANEFGQGLDWSKYQYGTPGWQGEQQQSQFDTGQGNWEQQFAEMQRQFNEQLKQNKSNNNKSFFSSLFSSLGSMIPGIGGLFKDKPQ